jgi:hypothetical protein
LRIAHCLDGGGIKAVPGNQLLKEGLESRAGVTNQKTNGGHGIQGT